MAMGPWQMAQRFLLPGRLPMCPNRKSTKVLKLVCEFDQEVVPVYDMVRSCRIWRSSSARVSSASWWLCEQRLWAQRPRWLVVSHSIGTTAIPSRAGVPGR